MNHDNKSLDAEVFTDGGVIGRNPSELGGTWAYIMVPTSPTFGIHDWPEAMQPYATWLKGRCVVRDSGVVAPSDIGLKFVSNNVTELWAAMEALERMPAGWGGNLCTDSGVTQCRLVNKSPSFRGIPADLRDRFWKARQRAGAFRVTLLSGHPTKAHLAAGIGKRGTPVSEWNVACDEECNRLARVSRSVVAHELA